jgi:hypothetical protein
MPASKFAGLDVCFMEAVQPSSVTVMGAKWPQLAEDRWSGFSPDRYSGHSRLQTSICNVRSLLAIRTGLAQRLASRFNRNAMQEFFA